MNAEMGRKCKNRSYNTAFVCLKTLSLTSPPALPALLQVLFLLGKVIMNYLNSLIRVVSYLKRSLLWGLAEVEGLGSRPWFAWSREAQIQAVLGRWFEAESFVVFPHFVYFCWSKNPQKEVNYQFSVGLLKLQPPLRPKFYFFTLQTICKVQPEGAGVLANMLFTPHSPSLSLWGCGWLILFLLICMLGLLSCEKVRAGAVCEVGSECRETLQGPTLGL